MPIFVVQEHHATHLHYDFRLEIDKVLRSWAVPKPPPLDKETKRLAIQVDDHALSYAKFEGEIKEGYGKGTVKIWDKGNYELDSLKPKKIVFHLKGKKMKGKYVLLKTSYGKNSWLLMKMG
jgi:DNA ligase D-like protein (predicted 3'-phosphoesterase)